MEYRISATLEGLDEALAYGLDRFEHAVTDGVREGTAGLKEDLRDQVEAAGLGRRLAYTWQADVYPDKGASLDAAGYVYTKAPKIMNLFATGATIRPHDGNNFLWIPTDAVPRARGARRGSKQKMTPEEVEREFNADIYVRKGRNGRFLAFIDVVRAKSRNRPGYRPATKGRLRQGRVAEPVLMFTLARNVKGRKEVDLDAAANRWGARTPALIEKNWRE